MPIPRRIEFMRVLPIQPTREIMGFPGNGKIEDISADLASKKQLF